MVVPSSLNDVRALLDNTDILNTGMPSIAEAGTDDLVLLDDAWESLSSPEYKNAYVWAENIFDDRTTNNWNRVYQAIFYTNLALESLNNLTVSDQESAEGKELRGIAHFLRAWYYFQLAQIYCDHYDPSIADTKLGLPLRLQSDMTIPHNRSSLKEIYDAIGEDLEKAVLFLPEKQLMVTRPSKTAAYGLKAIINLQVGNFDLALKDAEASLNIYSELIDYNTINDGVNNPFTRFNKEVIFHSTLFLGIIFTENYLNIAPEIYSQYSENDLRKTLFFKTNGRNLTFRGSYNGTVVLFNGIATDEIHLILAECHARKRSPDKALDILNSLLQKRYKTDTYERLTHVEDGALINLVLNERRKQLIFRGRRWWDLRRLNSDSRFSKELKREVSGRVYELLPQSKKYTLPIPPDVIRLSGLEQNPR